MSVRRAERMAPTVLVLVAAIELAQPSDDPLHVNQASSLMEGRRGEPGHQGRADRAAVRGDAPRVGLHGLGVTVLDDLHVLARHDDHPDGDGEERLGELAPFCDLEPQSSGR